MTVAHSRGLQLVRFDTTLQTPLQNAFFTSIGFGASYQLLRLGGPLVLRFFLFAAAVAVLQNVVGAGVAVALGQEPAAWSARRFCNAHRRPGYRSRVCAALRAGRRCRRRYCCRRRGHGRYRLRRPRWRTPRHALAGTRRALRFPARASRNSAPARVEPATRVVEDHVPEPPSAAPSGEDPEAYVLLKHLVLMLVAMWIGGFLEPRARGARA